MNINKFARLIKHHVQDTHSKIINRQVETILSRTIEPSTLTAESCFDELQSRFQPQLEYAYDALSIFRRASKRALAIQNILGIERNGLSGLDLGSGDGMLSVCLRTLGHEMTLTDAEDWRVESARSLSFFTADCCVEIPLPDNSFDFVVSYNAFEHFPNPTKAYSEALRVLRPQGLMYFQFNPLYCSPWGLHAYRMLRMPYPQYLFSDEFIKNKLLTEGIWDLGRKLDQLQTLNQWKPKQFDNLWSNSEVEILEYKREINNNYLKIINQFPESFQGRNLSLEDVITSGITVTLRKI